MAEYIEREALLMNMMHGFHYEAEGGCNNPMYGIAIKVIEEAPAADVAPVVHGEWLKNDDNVWWEGSETRFCSCCGQAINVECIPWFKFCPNCGAKMDGGIHNEQT